MPWYENKTEMILMQLRKGMPVISPKYGKGHIRGVDVKRNVVYVFYLNLHSRWWNRTQGHKVNTVKRYRQRYLTLKDNKRNS